MSNAESSAEGSYRERGEMPAAFARRQYEANDSRIRVLYKYQCMRPYTLSTLAAGEIFLSAYEDLNDPFDPFVRIIDFLSKRTKDELGNLLVTVLAGAAVFCLSETPREQLLWAHYANCWRGFCVGYACPVGFNPRLLFPMEYVSSLRDIVIPETGQVLPDRLLQVKSSVWSYEREWRLIVSGPAARGLQSNLLPIVEVIFGSRMPADERAAVRAAVASYDPVFKVAIPMIKDGVFGIYTAEESILTDADDVRFAVFPLPPQA